MGFVIFIIVVAAVAGAVSEMSDFITQYGYWIAMAIAAAVGYKYVRRTVDQAEAQQEKALAEADRRRLAQQASGGRVSLEKKKKALGDDEGEEESFFSDIQHMSR